MILQLRAVAGCLWWRPSASRGERSVTAILLAAVGAAWVVLIVMAVSVAGGSSAAAARGAMTGMAGMPGMSAGGASAVAALQGLSDTRGMDGMGDMAIPPRVVRPGTSPRHAMTSMGFVASMGMWALMVVAMMLPSAVPAVRHVAANSLRRRRARAMVTFAAIYLVIWMAVGAVVMAALPAWTALDPDAVAAGALALAAVWQLSLPKRRALRDCHRPSPLPPSGRRATAGVARFALRNGTACVRACWAMMLAMAVATTATTFWMVAITGLVLTEKLAPRPRQATRAGAVLLAAGSALVVAGALL
jgi:predicted metal-binding membrane protein